jgi:hypothetical protein
MRTRRLAPAAVCAAAILGLAASAAHADLIADGVTYGLTATTLSSTTDLFTLTITGINGAADTEAGRYGFDAVAFNLPAQFSSATAVTSGFMERDGGLNSSGCNGNGNFFCFSGFLGTSLTGPALAANSTLTFAFDLTLSSGTFASYDPDFKIDWVGTQNNYNLVSKPLDPTFVSPVPGPVVGAGLPGLIMVGGGLLGWWRRKRKAEATA